MKNENKDNNNQYQVRNHDDDCYYHNSTRSQTRTYPWSSNKHHFVKVWCQTRNNIRLSDTTSAELVTETVSTPDWLCIYCMGNAQMFSCGESLRRLDSSNKFMARKRPASCESNSCIDKRCYWNNRNDCKFSKLTIASQDRPDFVISYIRLQS